MRSISLKIIGLITILIASNWIYTRFFLENDIQKFSGLINTVRNLDPDASIIYIGESSNVSYDKYDRDTASIGKFIGDFYPELVVGDITKKAGHAGIYKVLLSKIPPEKSVKTVIVTLNLRSFGMDWVHSSLETSLQRSLILLQPYPPLFNRFLLSFKGYENLSETERNRIVRKLWKEQLFDTNDTFPYHSVFEWDRGMAIQGVKDETGQYDNAKTELACHYIKSYAFTIDTLSHPRIKDLNQIVQMAQKRNWNLVFNLMSENVSKANELVGSNLVQLMETNRDLLVDYYTRRGVLVVDNLSAVPDPYFIDQDWTTEHYAEYGRKIIAKNVAEGIRKWYENEFVSQTETYYLPNSFTLDCESSSQQVSGASFTQEVARSGKQSSKFGGEQPYSLTFQSRLQDISSDRRNGVTISFYIFQPDSFTDPKLVIDFLPANDGPGRYWESIKLSELDQHDTNEPWQFYTYELKDSILLNRDGLLKIYLWNESDQDVFVDDLSIKFGKNLP